MKVFVHGAIFGNDDYPAKITFEEDRTRISIINIIDASSHRHEYIEFEIPFFHDPKYAFASDVCLDVSKLVAEEKKYIFRKGQNPDDDSIYALVRCHDRLFGEPGEIYIPAEDSEKVTILKKFNFYSKEFAGENFLDKMYFIKIHLSVGESIPLYLSTEESDKATECVLFSVSEFGLNAGEINDSIYLSGYKQYIALSELESLKKS